MNRKAEVYCRECLAGVLEEVKGTDNTLRYEFTYDQAYLQDESLPSVSLSLPRRAEEYSSPCLFPFFFGLLAEGRIKELQCRQLRIDEDDLFGRLIKTAGKDCIGAVTVRELKPE